MHERRNFVLVMALICSGAWCALTWFWLGAGFGEAAMSEWVQRWVSLSVVVLSGAWLCYALFAEDKLPDHLAESVGDVYYEVDGLCFMPMMRVGRDGRAELCIYYQNRFENPVNAVVHLRPPQDSFAIKEGTRDAHFAFRASGGDFGCIHQPIAVPGYLQGEVVPVELAAACYFPRGKGNCLRRTKGIACGTMNVDWQGAAFKMGVHMVSGEVELQRSTTIRLCMPNGVKSRLTDETSWRQERLAPASELASVA